MAQTHDQTPSPPSLTQLLEHPGLAGDETSGRPPLARHGQSLMSVDSASDSGVAPTEDALQPLAGARKRSRTQDASNSDSDSDEFQAPILRSGSGILSDQTFFPRALATSLATADPPEEATEDPDVSASAQCPICMEVWGITGDHRLVALKCGHLYGQSCIRRWIRQSKNARCPSCQLPAKQRDLRVIFARALTAQDSQENVRLAREVARLREEVRRAQDEMVAAQHRYMAMRVEVKRAREEHDRAFKRARWLETENRALRLRVQGDADLAGDPELPSDLDLPGDLENPDNPDPPDSPDQHIDDAAPPLLQLRAAVAIPSGGARVIALDPHTPTAYVSSGSTMRRISLLDPSSAFTLPALHSAEIRSAAISPHPGARYLLTASSDHTAALTLLACAPAHDPQAMQSCNPQVCLRVNVGAPAWACAWDAGSPHVFHVGGVGGRLMTFDLRKPGAPVACRVAPEARACWADGSPAERPNLSPINSVVAQPDAYLAVANAKHIYRVPPDPSAPWTQVTEEIERRTCLSLSAHGPRLAAFFRVLDDDGTQSTAHGVYEQKSLLPIRRAWPCPLHAPVDSPQTRMARSALWGFRRRPGGRLHVVLAAPIEARRCVRLWDATAKVPVVLADLETPGSDEEIVDVAACQWPDAVDDDREGFAVLATLSASTLRVYDVR